MSDTPAPLFDATGRDAIAAAFAGRSHPSHQAPEQQRARMRAETDQRFPVLAMIMTAGAGLLVAKPGTKLTAWVPTAEIRYLHTIETLGEVREDKPNGRAVRYSVQRFDVTPAGKRILERNGLI